VKNVNVEVMVIVTASVEASAIANVALVTVIVKEATNAIDVMTAQLVGTLVAKERSALLAVDSVVIVNIDLVSVAMKAAGKMIRALQANSVLALAEVEIVVVGIVIEESVVVIVVEVEIAPILISCLVVSAMLSPAMSVVKKPCPCLCPRRQNLLPATVLPSPSKVSLIWLCRRARNKANLSPTRLRRRIPLLLLPVCL
jgi:hypothetical protein